MSRFLSTALPAAILAVEVICVAAVAVRVTGKLTAVEDSLALKVVVGLTLAIAQVCGITILLGAVGQLRLIPVLVLHLLLAAGTFVVIRPPAVPRSPHPVDPRVLVVVVVCMVPASVAVALGLAGRSIQADTMHYHLVNAAHWLTTGGLGSLAYATPSWYTSTYPSNGEIFATWAMLPSHMDQLAYVTPLVFGLLAFVAVIAAVEELGGRPEIGALAALTLLAAPLVWTTSVNSVETDLAGASGLITGLALFLHARARPGLLRWPILAGVAIGLGVGSKYTATIPAAAVLAIGLAVVDARRWVSGALAAGSALLAGGAWYLRNLLLAHDPVFPQPVAVGPLRLFEGATGPLYESGRTLLKQAIQLDLATLTVWLGYLVIYVGPALILVAAGLAAPIFHRGRHRRVILALSGLALVAVLAYLSTPFSAGMGSPMQNKIGTFLIGSDLRYALPAMLVAVIVAAAALPRNVTLLACLLGFAFDLYGIIRGPGFRDDIGVHTRTVVIAAALGVLGTAGWLALRGLPEPAAARLRRFHHHGPARIATVAAAALSVWLVLATSMAVAAPKERGRDTIDRAVELSHASHPTIAVIDVYAVGTILGTRLDRSFTAVGDGDAGTQHSLPSSAAFNARIDRIKPDIVVVTTASWTIASSRPPDWRPPPSWSLVGTDSGEAVYLTGARP